MAVRDGADFVRDLVALNRDRRTGVLEVRGDGAAVFLYFSEGTPVFAESGSLGDTLGRVMLEDGLLTREQYAQVVEQMTAELVTSEQMRFGEVTVQLGFLSPQQVHEALSHQVRRKLVGCLQWESPARIFDPAPEALAEVGHFPCPFDASLMEGMRRFFDPERAHRVVEPLLDRRLRLTCSVEEAARRLELGAHELRVLRQIDGVRTAAEVLAASPLDSVLSFQLLTALILLGVCSAHSQPQSQSQSQSQLQAQAPKQASNAEVAQEAPSGSKTNAFKENPTTSTRAVSHATRSALRALRKGAPAAPREESPKARAAEIAESFHARFGGPPTKENASAHARASRTPPDDRSRKLKAEKSFGEGLQHFSRSAWANAAGAFHEACRLDPETHEYEVYALWADFQATEGTVDRDKLRAALRDTVNQALARDRRFAFAHYVAGNLFLLEGKSEKALRAFRVCAQLDSGNLDAQRQVRLLTMRSKKKR